MFFALVAPSRADVVTSTLSLSGNGALSSSDSTISYTSSFLLTLSSSINSYNFQSVKFWGWAQNGNMSVLNVGIFRQSTNTLVGSVKIFGPTTISTSGTTFNLDNFGVSETAFLANTQYRFEFTYRFTGQLAVNTSTNLLDQTGTGNAFQNIYSSKGGQYTAGSSANVMATLVVAVPEPGTLMLGGSILVLIALGVVVHSGNLALFRHLRSRCCPNL